jgi:hypothetical protein
MAKKVANGRNKRQPRSQARNLSTDSESDSQSGIHGLLNNSNYSHLIRELISNPAVKYVAGGIATAVLSRLATNMSEKYPELSRFLKENIDNFEGRLGQFRPGLSGDSESRIS